MHWSHIGADVCTVLLLCGVLIKKPILVSIIKVNTNYYRLLYWNEGSKLSTDEIQSENRIVFSCSTTQSKFGGGFFFFTASCCAFPLSPDNTRCYLLHICDLECPELSLLFFPHISRYMVIMGQAT